MSVNGATIGLDYKLEAALVTLETIVCKKLFMGSERFKCTWRYCKRYEKIKTIQSMIVVEIN